MIDFCILSNFWLKNKNFPSRNPSLKFADFAVPDLPDFLTFFAVYTDLLQKDLLILLIADFF